MRDDLVEAVALAMANYDAVQVDCPQIESVADFRFDSDRSEYISRAHAIIPIVLSAAAGVARDQAKQFLSEEYATPQPIGSIMERFACEEVAKAILELGS
jgi:hypothetical protein